MQSDVRPVGYSGDADAGLFDAHLLDDSGPAHSSPPASCTPRPPGHCNDASNLLSPENVFSPSAAPPPAMNETQPLVASLGAGQGALTAQNSVPAFLGDFFGGGSSTIMGDLNSDTPLAGVTIPIPLSNSVGIMKLAENTSPIPRDRVFFSYNYFSNVNLVPGGTGVSRFTPGFEKTFLEGRTSVEFRVPMATTLGSNSTVDFNQGNVLYDSNRYQLGNLTTFFKALLLQDEQFAVSTGLGVSAPTASALRVNDNYGNQLALVNNQSWHLLPFVGGVYTPTDRLYVQGLMQLDIAANGSSVYVSNYSGDLAKIGTRNDPAYLFTSVGSGYWFYEAADDSSLLTRAAIFSELHFNNSLEATDPVVGFGTAVGSQQHRIQTINAVIGTNLILDQNKSLLLGYVTPLGGGVDQSFSGEFRLLFNWYFGAPLNRATRIQF